MRVVALMLCAALAACASPRIVTKPVNVPVAVKCKPNLPPTPAYAADVVPLETSDIYELVRALLIDREQRKARQVETDAALGACAAD